MLVATLPAIEGRAVQWYLGIVTGETILDKPGLRDLELRRAREAAIETMATEAAARGANAVIGVGLGYQAISVRDEGTVLMVSASGTAVRI